MAAEFHSVAAKGGSAKGATLPSHDHPQRLHLHRLEKPAPTLEAWLDGGLFSMEDEEGNDAVKGQKRLPLGYEGCTQESVLVEATKPGVLVWPVRFDLGELSIDGSKPWTLYHYTHVKSFGVFAKELAASDEAAPAGITDMVYDFVMDDFNEREPTPGPHNPKGDLELMSVEPGMFRSKKEIRKAMFGGKRQGTSEKGHFWEEFADYCIPLRVPGSACRLEGGAHSKEKMRVMVSKEVLDALRVKAEAHRAILQVKREHKEHRRTVHHAKDVHGSPFGCLGFLFGGHGKHHYDDDEEDFEEKKQELVAGMDVVNRSKRELGHRQMQMRRNWMEEHFAHVKKSEEAEERRKQAEHRKAELRKAQAAKGEAAKEEPAAAASTSTKSKASEKAEAALKEQKERIAQMQKRASKFIAEETNKQAKPESTAQQARRMCREYTERTEGQKEIARGALNRMKSRRGERLTVTNVEMHH